MTTEKIKERIKKYVSETPSNWMGSSDDYEANKDWLNKSALIAIKILRTIRSQSTTQKELAESIGVTPQYINKVVKGRENLTLETVCKIEKSLGISLISVPAYETSQDGFDRDHPFIQKYQSIPKS